MMAMLLVQLMDGIIGIIIKSRLKTFGPFLMAICHMVCLIIYF